MFKLQKVSKRYRQFKNHPITCDKILPGLFRYFKFHIKNKLIYEQEVSWVEGLKLFVRKGDAGLVANIYFGLYEYEESIFLLHFLEKDDLFLDIGANLGHYSLLLSGLKKCRSLAVEPVPKTYSQLCRNITLNDLHMLIKPLQLGVSNKQDILCFSTDRNTMDRIVGLSYPNSIQVEVQKIDDLIDQEIPAAIKLDVEGYEYFALEEAEKVLNSPFLKVLVIELNRSGERYGILDEVTFEFILSKGFYPFTYDPSNRKLKKLKTFNRERFNTIFIRDEEYVQSRLLKSRKINIRHRNF